MTLISVMDFGKAYYKVLDRSYCEPREVFASEWTTFLNILQDLWSLCQKIFYDPLLVKIGGNIIKYVLWIVI